MLWRGRAIRCGSDRSTSSPGRTSGMRRPEPTVELVVRTDELSHAEPDGRNAILGGCAMLNLPQTERTTLKLRPL